MTLLVFARLVPKLFGACKEIKMKDFRKQVLELAEQLGDRLGLEVDTVEYIAGELQVSEEEVFEIFEEITNPAD